MPQINNAALEERAKVNELRPKLADVAKAMGKEVKYKTFEDGTHGPYFEFSPNDGYGKTSKEWGTAHEAMKPWVRADTERVAKANQQPGEYGVVSHGKIAILGRIPRCEGQGHDYRESGRCWWCGASKDAG